MPEIPGSNSVPGGSIPGRGAVPPRAPNIGASSGTGGAAPVTGTAQSLPEKVAQALPKYFGFHTDASLMARLAGMGGVAPSLGNLRVAQQLLRYGQGLDADQINQLAHLWSQYGGNDVLVLEALVVLQSQNLPINGQNLQAMMQLLGGGPLSHLLARLTMALKGEGNAKLAGLGQKLTAFWQLGHLDKDMIAQLGKFQQLLGGIEAELAALDLRSLSPETAAEAGKLRDLLDANKLLANQSNPQQYLPFFIWRDQQPLPAELIVQNEGGGESGTMGFMRVTLAVETKNLGRITVDITYMRDHLNARFDVVDEKVKKLLDTRLVLLRQRLMAVPYTVDLLSSQAIGASRSVSALLPKRRDLKKLSRAHGVL